MKWGNDSRTNLSTDMVKADKKTDVLKETCKITDVLENVLLYLVRQNLWVLSPPLAKSLCSCCNNSNIVKQATIEVGQVNLSVLPEQIHMLSVSIKVTDLHVANGQGCKSSSLACCHLSASC